MKNRTLQSVLVVDKEVGNVQIVLPEICFKNSHWMTFDYVFLPFLGKIEMELEKWPLRVITLGIPKFRDLTPFYQTEFMYWLLGRGYRVKYQWDHPEVTG